MFLKIMGSENLPEHDSNKAHTIIEVAEYSVDRDSEDLSGDLFITYRAGGHNYQRRVFGNIYVMNADGKTINTITPTPRAPE